jgi:hypothetical protein
MIRHIKRRDDAYTGGHHHDWDAFGVSPIRPGDVVQIESWEIGILKNTVIAE